MNYWLLEIVAEDDRKEIWRRMHQIRLEEKIVNGKTDYSALIGRSLILLGLWLVTYGRHLQKRYARPWDGVSSPQPRLSVRPH